MDPSNVISGADFTKLQSKVDSHNKALLGGRDVKNTLDKDDFLKFLVTQLTHQDPTQPMKTENSSLKWPSFLRSSR